ncbi:MAG: hypothetical protein AB7P40_00125 [Chloroflexota bacterium]
MSRRRETWTADGDVTTDELLAHLYGERLRIERQPMPGCQSRCYSPGIVVTERQVVAVLWRGVWWALSLEIAVVVAVLALVWLVRGIGG